tara:strand:- start:624 stop:1187 length:564 start_codon:yes stop_codon:yes gene_type:complete
MALPLPPWRPLIRAAQQREGRSPAARWLQLATVALDGTPRVRTLVFRGWGGPDQVDLLTDARSAKAPELERQPAVELCWLMPKAKQQFRLRGRWQPGSEVVAAERQRHWQQLSSSGRALWAWPAPGRPWLPSDCFVEELPAEAAIPEHFQLLRLQIERVEQLDLGQHPHLRLSWCREQQWRPLRLRP